MRLKIISDGGVSTTKVVDADTGDVLQNVVAVEWRADGRSHADHGHATAVITVCGVPVDVEVEADAWEQRRA